MIVLNKKRLILIVSMVCFSLTAFMVKDSFTNNKIVETVNLPVSNKVIVLDAGHGVPDERSTK
jgi:N-acetylmuramoyl-L-alanine amidase